MLNLINYVSNLCNVDVYLQGDLLVCLHASQVYILYMHTCTYMRVHTNTHTLAKVGQLVAQPVLELFIKIDGVKFRRVFVTFIN